jgi:hypothetical protein
VSRTAARTFPNTSEETIMHPQQFAALHPRVAALPHHVPLRESEGAPESAPQKHPDRTPRLNKSKSSPRLRKTGFRKSKVPSHGNGENRDRSPLSILKTQRDIRDIATKEE